jgi:predicted neuraminidase
LWQGIPAIERAQNGRLWAAYYSGGAGEGSDNFVILITSADNGKTWSRESLVVTAADKLGPIVREFDPCLWIDPTGKLWLFWAQSFSDFDARFGVWAISTGHPGDAAPAWSAPHRITDGIMLNKPIAVSATRWLLPVGRWRNINLKLRASSLAASGMSEAAVSHKTDERAGSELYETTDGLHSVHKLGGADVPDTWFDEHMAVERKDKSLWMLVRTTYGIGNAVSTDDGHTWTSQGDTKLGRVNSRFFIRRLKSGNLLLVCNLPESGNARTNMVARLSTDDGKTWSNPLVLDSRTLVSYPDGVESPDGHVYLIYDHDRGGDADILLATFTEKDVFAGKLVSKGSQLMQVIDSLAPDKKAREAAKGGN